MTERLVLAIPPLLAILAMLVQERPWRHGDEPSETDMPPAATRLAIPPSIPPPPSRTFATTPETRLRIRLGAARDRSRAEGYPTDGRLTLDADGRPRELEFVMQLRSVVGTGGVAVADVLGPQRFSALSFHGTCRSYTTSPLPGLATAEFVGVIDIGATTTRVVVRLQVVRIDVDSLRLLGNATVLGSAFGLPRRWSLLPFSGESPMTVVWDLVLEAADE